MKIEIREDQKKKLQQIKGACEGVSTYADALDILLLGWDDESIAHIKWLENHDDEAY